MNKINIYVLTFFLSLAGVSIYAQNNRSQVVITSGQDNNVFFHTIEKGQTVYAIATMYGVTPDDIYRLNPDSKEGIKAGATLKIPQRDIVGGTAKKQDGNYIFHTIQPKETLYSLSIRYTVPATAIVKANPGLSTSTFTIGKTIRIPATQVEDLPTTELKTVTKEIEYTVQKKETMYRICRKFNISSYELIKLNPKLKEGVKAGMTIKIPVQAEENMTTEPATTMLSERDVNALLSEPKSIERVNSVKVALLLPFMTNETIPSTETQRFIEYYEGLLLAVDSLKNTGCSIDLSVYDTGNGTKKLKEILKEDYRILEAANGEECLEQLERYGTGISLVLLDIVMPEMDGFEVLAAMNQNHWIEDIPVIMISSEDSDSYIRRAYEMGVSDYISCPFDAKIVYQRVLNMIKLYAKQRRLIHLVTRQIYEKERNNRMMIGILSQIVEFRNGESGLHVIHINLITQLLLEQLVKKTGKYQLSWEDRLLIATASALHDIGKIGIDEKILNKPGKLTKEEFEIMKTHTLIGAQMLDNLDMYRNEKLLKLAHEICRWHHERYDGKGYPDGLVGEEIPISAQVVSLADVYDALVSERVYKKAFSHEKALEMIQNGECGTFNPLLLQCMTEAQDKLKTMMEVAEKE